MKHCIIHRTFLSALREVYEPSTQRGLNMRNKITLAQLTIEELFNYTNP